MTASTTPAHVFLGSATAALPAYAPATIRPTNIMSKTILINIVLRFLDPTPGIKTKRHQQDLFHRPRPAHAIVTMA